MLDGNLLAQRTTAEEVEYTGGLQALAEALEFNATLTHLSLRNNVLGPESLKVLATGLYDNAGEPQLHYDWKAKGEGQEAPSQRDGELRADAAPCPAHATQGCTAWTWAATARSWRARRR